MYIVYIYMDKKIYIDYMYFLSFRQQLVKKKHKRRKHLFGEAGGHGIRYGPPGLAANAVQGVAF